MAERAESVSGGRAAEGAEKEEVGKEEVEKEEEVE